MCLAAIYTTLTKKYRILNQILDKNKHNKESAKRKLVFGGVLLRNKKKSTFRWVVHLKYDFDMNNTKMFFCFKREISKKLP